MRWELRTTAMAWVMTLLTATVGVARGDDGVYDVGAARVDVTPGYPIRLNGFGYRRDESEGVTQRIWAKALAIGSDEAGPVILITLDSLGIRESMVDEVARRLKKKAGVERDRVAVAFSHSHTTPMVAGACQTIFSSPIPPEHQANIDRYTAELTDALEEAALKALADRQPSTLSWNVGKVSFAANRRTPGGPVDHDLPMMVVKSVDDGAMRAIMVSYACHCVTLSNNKISGDWAGYAQEAIERTHPGVIALVSIGCGSDSNPSSGVTGDNTAAAADQGAQINDEVDRLLAGPLKPISGPISAALSHIDLPLNPLPSRQALEELAAAEGAAAYNAKFQLAKLDRGEPLQSKLDYPIQTVVFGDSLAMVFLAGEVCADYALRLKSELDPARIWLHGYSNDFCAYIPSERLLREGRYGGGAEVVYFALPATLAAGLEEKIIAQVHKQLPPRFEGTGPRLTTSTQPWPLDEALASIRVNEKFVVEIAAAEPLVADPVAIDFGPDGRLWVAEMPDYSRFAEEEFEPSGSVRCLVDRDADGRYDEATTFCAGLRFPTDAKAWRKGVIVCDAPEVLYFEDADGDGQAETRRVLLSGFETHNAQARVNSLRWGLDNWLYGSCGLFGGKITTSSGLQVDLRGQDFRFRPGSGELEPVAGKTQQGRSRDDWGNWFGCENSSLIDHYPLSDRYLSRNPHIVPPPAEVFVPAGNDARVLYPIGAPTLFKLSGPPGRPTSVCGLDLYRDDLLGDDMTNNAFVAEPVNQLVHRRVLTPRGATFAGSRAKEEARTEFLASSDPWFRPVQIRTGLDGCLYVVDMHRAVIEHQKFIPEETLSELDLTAGRDQGRIYRVRPREAAPRPFVRLDLLPTAELARALDSSNGTQRDCVQHLLVDRGDNQAVPILRKMARESSRPVTRLQALCALEGLAAIDAASLSQALIDASPSVRRHAIRLSEPLLASSADLRAKALQLVDDPDPQVQLQLAYTLGEVDDPRAAQALARLAINHHDDPYILAGVWSSVDAANVGVVVNAILRESGSNEVPSAMLAPVISLVVALGTEDDVLALATALGPEGEFKEGDWRFAAAAQLLVEARQKDRVTEGLSQALAPAILAARQTLADEESVEALQLTALRMLAARGDEAQILNLLTPLLEPRRSPAVQLSAIDVAAAIGGPDAAGALLEAWRGFTPAGRAKAFDVLLGTKEFVALLLDDMAAGKVSAAELDALQRQRLLDHPDAAIRARADAAFAGAIDHDRDKIVNAYLAANVTGDAGRGRQKFSKHCAGCHRLEGQGHEVGPDLAALTSRTTASLVESILDPNRAVDERFRSYSAQTIDGLACAGILTGETSTSITLLEQEGKSRTLLRTDLEVLENTGKSLMPEGLERDLTHQDVADLIAYLALVGPSAKKIEGNEPRTVSANDEGILKLLAAEAEIFGEQITFEQPYQNIGFWHGVGDYVAWTIELTEPGEFDVYLQWACADQAAGNDFIIEGGLASITGVVGSTGGYDRFFARRIGSLSLPGGASRLTLRPDGVMKTGHLMDLRGIYLAPVGASPDHAIAGAAPAEVQDAAAAIASLLVDLQVGQPREYERIPAIWQEAIAAGRRNDSTELLRVIDLSLPEENQPLADWQSVVLGGGVINGLSQRGLWPAERMSELLRERPAMQIRWERTMTLAAEMADNPKVRTGTRYDALRILGVGDWETQGDQIAGYLGKDISPELQMGAVSALCDMQSDQAAALLLKSLPELTESNRTLAIEGLLRTPERASTLLEALEAGTVDRASFTDEQKQKLEQYSGGS